MLIYFFLPLVAGLLNGLTEIFNKSITEKKYSAFSYSFLQWCGNLLIYSIPFIYFRDYFPTDYHAYIPLVIVVIIVFIGNILLIRAYKTEDASIVNIISRISLVIGFFNGVIFLSESITVPKVIGILFIVFGIFIIFYHGKKLKPSLGLALALVSGICFGMMSFLNKLALPYYVSSTAYLVAANIFAVSLFLLKPTMLKDVKPILTKHFRNYLLSRIFAASGYLILTYAISRADVSVVNTNFETAFLLSVVAIGIIFLKEKKNIKKKIAGALFCTLGIFFLNFF